jgi:flagellar hook-associated protein 2
VCSSDLTLKQAFDKISTATGGAVTATYSAATDKLSLSSASPIILGSANDTSNFLQVVQLTNNGTGTVTSAGSLGKVQLANTLANSNLKTTVSDGGSGAGQFTINGVAISFNASTDGLQNILDRINNSTAGVLATYDPLSNRFSITNKTTGDMGISLSDVTGNFLAATGLSGGALQRGKNLLYTINGGPQLTSQTNVVTGSSSGIAGLSVTALKEGGSATVTVSKDTQKIKTAINDFVSEYNRVQSLIDSQTATTTDPTGKIIPGTLTGQTEADEIASKLRNITYSPIAGGSSVVSQLAALGVVSNGKDNSLSLSDTTTLDAALSNNLSAVQQLFTNSKDGIAVQLSSYIDHTIGDGGTLIAKQNDLTQQATDVDTQVANMERLITSDQDRMTQEFVAMESAQQKINQQLSFLQQRFGGSSPTG